VAEVDMLLFAVGKGRDCERSVTLCSTNSHDAGDVLNITSYQSSIKMRMRASSCSCSLVTPTSYIDKLMGIAAMSAETVWW
jgi:hypothetical protein